MLTYTAKESENMQNIYDMNIIIDVNSIIGLLNLSESSFKQLGQFIVDAKAENIKYGSMFYINLVEYFVKKINNKIIFKKNKYELFINKYDKLLAELNNQSLFYGDLESAIRSDTICFDFLEIYNQILNNYDKKEEMLKNIKYFKRLGVTRVEYLKNLDCQQRTYNHDVFYTDGDVEWCDYKNGIDYFDVTNANFILSNNERIDYNKVRLSSLLFRKPLPTYDVINKNSLEHLISDEQLTEKRKASETVKNLVQFDHNLDLTKKFEQVPDQIEDLIDSCQYDILKSKIKTLNELQQLLKCLTNEVITSYDSKNIIPKDKMLKMLKSYNPDNH